VPGTQGNGALNQFTLGLDPLPRKTRKEVFLEEMNQVVQRWWPSVPRLPEVHTRPWWRPTCPNRDHAAHPLPAAVVEPERSSHGRRLHERLLNRRFASLHGAALMPAENTTVPPDVEQTCASWGAFLFFAPLIAPFEEAVETAQSDAFRGVCGVSIPAMDRLYVGSQHVAQQMCAFGK